MHLFHLVFLFSSDIYPGVELLGCYVSPIFSFLRNLHSIFDRAAVSIYFSTEHKGCLFSTFLSTIAVFCLLDNPLRYSCLENPHRQRSPVGYSPEVHPETSMHTCLLDNSHPNLCKMIAHCGFDLHFPDD